MKYRLKKDLPWAKAGSEWTKDFESDEGLFMTGGSFIKSINGFDFPLETFSDWFEPIEERWKPKESEKYWKIDSYGNIDCDWNNHDLDDSAIRFGNCFRTREQAEEAARRVKKCLEDYHKEIGE